MPINTHQDWNAERVDLLSCCGIAQHFGIPVELVWTMAASDAQFPHYQRDSRGCRRWRLPDVIEYLEGQRY
jgi:hypothetical protein